MNIYGLIGFPLSHSISAQYFSEKFFKENIHDTSYNIFPIESIEMLLPLIKATKDLKGLNVTIPYKQSVLKYLTSIDKVAEEVGAVNTIKINRGKSISLIGFNTDVFGFEESIKPLLKKHYTKALILGTGGAARAVAYVLNKIGIEFNFVSREKHGFENTFLYSELNEEIIISHHLIINATPIGMFPNIHEAPAIPYEFITKDYLLFDLVYNPTETLFIKKGLEKCAVVSNGSQMLYLQAEKSWSIWNEE